MKLKQLFESHLTDYNEIKAWLDKMDITNYEIHPNGVVVDGDVALYSAGLTSIPVKFKAVSGNFSCSYGNLTSLAGAPREVGGNFNCYYNNLTSLSGAPRYVGGSFDCEDNKLTSLAGAPREVGGNFYCENNNLKSLDFGAGIHIHGNLVVGDSSVNSHLPDNVTVDGEIR